MNKLEKIQIITYTLMFIGIATIAAYLIGYTHGFWDALRWIFHF